MKVTIGQVTIEGDEAAGAVNSQDRWARVELVLREGIERHADLVVLPELAVPREGAVDRLRQWAARGQFIVIAGLAYADASTDALISNEAVVVIPSTKPGMGSWRARTAPPPAIIHIKKLTPSPREHAFWRDKGIAFSPGNRLYLFNDSALGCFAVVICFDFLNLPVQALLQGRIATLIVVALNKDVQSFRHTAEAATRLLLCNVVICNSGRYGGSVALRPRREQFHRIGFITEGNYVECAATIELPSGPEIQQGRTETPKEWLATPPDFGAPLSTSARNVEVTTVDDPFELDIEAQADGL